MTLLILKVNQLGDNVVYLPVVQHLRRVLPDWKVVVYTSPVAEPLYTVACPGVEVQTFATGQFNASWKRPSQLLKLVSQTRSLRPDACLLGDDQGNSAHVVARFGGARLTVGSFLKRRHLGFLLHHRVSSELSDPVALQNWRLAGALLQKLGKGPLPADYPLPPDLSAFGRESHGAVLVHAGASREYKRWPMERYVALASRLAETTPVVWIIQGHAAEHALTAAVRQVKPCSLHEFIRLMAGARLFIGNNSGPMNIASALGIPGIIFNGPSQAIWDPAWHRERFELLTDPELPCQPCDHLDAPVDHCSNAAHPMACMDRWSVEVVHGKVLVRLRELASPPAA